MRQKLHRVCGKVLPRPGHPNGRSLPQPAAFAKRGHQAPDPGRGASRVSTEPAVSGNGQDPAAGV